MQAFGSTPRYGRLIAARSAGVVRAACRFQQPLGMQLQDFAGGRDPAMEVHRLEGLSFNEAADASYRRQET
ncbi:MAG TPA: hypothetical protein VGJ10_10220 [Paraburkholderia sp.]|jgi:hypothetical protein